MEINTQSQRILNTYDEDVLVFIDETGHEKLSSAGLFGLGGIMVRGAYYQRMIVQPWSKLRAEIGIAHGKPFHASENKSAYMPYVTDIARFFEDGRFVRHAAMVTTETVSDREPMATAAFGGLFRNFGRALVRFARSGSISRVVFVVEHSERLFTEYQKFAASRGPAVVNQYGERLEFPPVWAALKKSSCEPGLEVADFVLHAAHGHVRSRLKGKSGAPRLDFRTVFQSPAPDLVEYMEINTFESKPGDGPPGVVRIGLG